MNKADDRLLLVSVVARRLNVHPCTVRRWYKEGKLMGVKLSDRGLRIYVEAVQELTKGGKNEENQSNS